MQFFARKISSAFFVSILSLFCFSSVQADEVQIFSNEQREENSNTLILDFDDTGGNVNLQFGGSLGEELYWNSASDQFIFTDDVNIQGGIDVDGTITSGSSNIQITNGAGYIEGENIANTSIDDDSIDFGLGTDQVNAGDLSADSSALHYSSGNNVQQILQDIDAQMQVNTTNISNGVSGTDGDIFTLDQDGNATSVALKFGSSLNKTLVYDPNAVSSGDGAFVFADDVKVNGNIVLSGTVDGVDVSNLSGTVSGVQTDVSALQSNVGALQTDVTGIHSDISGVETDISGIESNVTTLQSNVGTLQTNVTGLQSDVTGLESNTGALQINIGSRTYTEQNVVTSGESVTSSLNAVDSALGDQTYTQQNYISNSQDLSDSLDALDMALKNTDLTLTSVENALGNRSYTNDYELTNGESVTSSLNALDTALGDRSQFSTGNVVQNGDSFADAITALDSALGGIGGSGIKTHFVSMNDLTVRTDSGTGQHQANLYNDTDSGVNPHQFYVVKSRKTSLQDLDLKFKVRLPEDFKNFSGSNDLRFFYKNTGTNVSDSKIDILVEDDEGDDAFSSSEGQSLFSASWSEYANEFDGASFNPEAGEYIYITIRGYGSYDTNYQSPYIGETLINFSSGDL